MSVLIARDRAQHREEEQFWLNAESTCSAWVVLPENSAFPLSSRCHADEWSARKRNRQNCTSEINPRPTDPYRLVDNGSLVRPSTPSTLVIARIGIGATVETTSKSVQ